MSRDRILESIKDSLHSRRKKIQEDGPIGYGHYLDITKIQEESLLAEYMRLQKENMSDFVVSSREFLVRDIQEVLKNSNSRKLLYCMDLPCDVNQLEGVERYPYEVEIQEARDKFFNIDTSLVRAECGVANLGIVGLKSSPLSPRLASLITEHCILLLDKTRIVKNLFDGIKFLTSSGELPTNLFFIAGPSRTADIELQTVFGVHGPRKTTVILY